MFLFFVLAAVPFVPADRGAIMYGLGLLVFAAVSFILAKIGAAIAAFIEGLLGKRHGA